MKFISWNVNGLRACVGKGFLDYFHEMDADFFCLQETKLQAGQIKLDLPGYQEFWNYAEKKGYSGTALFTKQQPLNVTNGIGVPELDNEGRVITAEYPAFFLVTCYTPNAQRGLARLDHRMRWDEAFRAYLTELDQRKPVIVCGDLNVAHKEIDLKNPSSNHHNAGFTDEERGKFTDLLDKEEYQLKRIGVETVPFVAKKGEGENENGGSTNPEPSTVNPEPGNGGGGTGDNTDES